MQKPKLEGINSLTLLHTSKLDFFQTAARQEHRTTISTDPGRESRREQGEVGVEGEVEKAKPYSCVAASPAFPSHSITTVKRATCISSCL